MLVDAPHDAALLARGKRLALEAVDARVEALLDEVRVHLWAGGLARDGCRVERGEASYVHELLHLLLLHAVLELTRLVLGKPGRAAGLAGAAAVGGGCTAYWSILGYCCWRGGATGGGGGRAGGR